MDRFPSLFIQMSYPQTCAKSHTLGLYLCCRTGTVSQPTEKGAASNGCSSFPVILHQLQSTFFRTGVPEILQRNLVRTNNVEDLIEICMSQCIGLGPDFILTSNQVGIRALAARNKGDIVQHRPNDLQPGIVSSKDSDSLLRCRSTSSRA